MLFERKLVKYFFSIICRICILDNLFIIGCYLCLESVVFYLKKMFLVIFVNNILFESIYCIL